MSGYLYIIVATGTDRPVKIGISENPEKRLRQLQTGNPFPLKLAAIFPAKAQSEAAGWEGLAHRLFADKRLCGEWFDVTRADITKHIEHWKRDPVRKGRRPAAAQYFGWAEGGLHPTIPDHLRGRRISSMTDDERLELWACYDLPAPPFGFDDWYIVGTPKTGVLAAFPVVGFILGEPD